MSGSKWLTPDCKYILDYGEVQDWHYVWADTYPRQNEYDRYSRIGSFDCWNHVLQLIMAVLLGHAVLRVRRGFDLVPLVVPGYGRHAQRREPT